MNNAIEFETLLVPVEHEHRAQHLVRHAAALAASDNPCLVVLHVLDTHLVDFAVDHALGERDVIVAGMRQRAADWLARITRNLDPRIEVDVVVCEGVPFLEVLRKSNDFAVDAVILGKEVTTGSMEKLLFGSTIEKVIRGCRRPVLIVPYNGTEEELAPDV